MDLVAAISFSYFGFMQSQGGTYAICIDCNPGEAEYVRIDAFNETDDGHSPPVRTVFQNPIGSSGPCLAKLFFTSQVSLYNHTFSTPGIHQIIIHNSGDIRGTPLDNSQITLDHIELTVPSTTSIKTTTGSDISMPTFSISITTSTSIQASNSALASSLSPSFPLGAVIGTVSVRSHCLLELQYSCTVGVYNGRVMCLLETRRSRISRSSVMNLNGRFPGQHQRQIPGTDSGFWSPLKMRKKA